MDPLARAVEAADGPWPIIAIAVIGLYVLAWRFGGQLLQVARENNQVAKEAHAEAKQISENIVTNHGSRSLGDAVDRLTDGVSQLRAELLLAQGATDIRLSGLENKVQKNTERIAKLEGATNG